jgi:hypothetical protein
LLYKNLREGASYRGLASAAAGFPGMKSNADRWLVAKAPHLSFSVKGTKAVPAHRGVPFFCAEHTLLVKAVKHVRLTVLVRVWQVLRGKVAVVAMDIPRGFL